MIYNFSNHKKNWWTKYLNTRLTSDRVLSSIFKGLCDNELDNLDPFLLAHYKYVFSNLGEEDTVLETFLTSVENSKGVVYVTQLPTESAVLKA